MGSSTTPSTSKDRLYFIFTTVFSVVAGLIVVGVILSILFFLVVRMRRKNKESREPTESPRQQSSSCYLTATYLHSEDLPLSGYLRGNNRDSPSSTPTSDDKGSPLAGSSLASSSLASTSTSSGSGDLHTNLLKHLGTSV